MTLRPSLTRLVGLTGFMLTAIAGCASLEPDVGALLAGTCDNTDTNPGVDISFSADIRTILSRSPGGCSCHVPTSTGPGAATLIVGLDLGSLESLREGGVTSGARIVVAGEPCSSIMYQKVSEAPPFGSRMPLNGPPYLSAEDRQKLHDWIAEGAKDN